MEKTNNIRIISLSLRDNKFLGDLDISFTDEGEIDSKQFYTTVLIGPNGCGKSYILSTLVDLFRELWEIKRNGYRKNYVSGKFILNYSYGNLNCSYRNMPNGPNDKYIFRLSLVPSGQNKNLLNYLFSINEVSVKDTEIILPGSIIASSMMLTDKFVFISDPNDYEIYFYNGLRSSRATAGTRTYIKNTVDHLIGALTSSTSKEKLSLMTRINYLMDFLELDKFLQIEYLLNRKEIFFKGELTINSFIGFFKNYEDTWIGRKKSENRDIVPWFGFKYFKNIEKDIGLISEIVEFCNRKVSNANSAIERLNYDIYSDSHSLVNDKTIIDHLYSLNLIKYPEIIIKSKHLPQYTLEGASSGEAHILSTIIGLISRVKDESLILIDEPEISLHPNWQMKYFDLLNNVFRDFSSCQFIIATHSHFLISDLKGESSKITGLKRVDNKIEVVDLPQNIDTYGWSAEDILYNVFNVASTRNKFVAEDIAKILDELSAGDKNKVNKLSIEKYEEIVQLEMALKENDPLKQVVKSILTKISK